MRKDSQEYKRRLLDEWCEACDHHFDNCMCEDERERNAAANTRRESDILIRKHRNRI